MGGARVISRTNPPDEFLGRPLAFVGRLSFEKRGYSAYQQLSVCEFCFVHFFVSLEESKESRDLRDRSGISEELTSRVDTHDPLQTQYEISRILAPLFTRTDDFLLVVDITTFRREELLILLKILSRLPEGVRDRTSFMYTSARTMGEWLSNNIRQLRPVIGFPGEIDSLKRTHLIILAGIEHHRALAAIQAYEPYSISLGMVPRGDSLAPAIYQRNLELRNFLKRHFEQIHSEFDFSATDAPSVKIKLRQIVSKLSDFNVVIAPLNTKLSTLGVGAFALEDRHVQLCYAEVDMYNSGNYSTPGDRVYIIDFNNLLR